MKNILVLCTGNSCRSQIAHGYLNLFSNGKATIYSAGIETHGLNPNAVKTMAGFLKSDFGCFLKYMNRSLLFDTNFTH